MIMLDAGVNVDSIRIQVSDEAISVEKL
jgi:hypothetical protein